MPLGSTSMEMASRGLVPYASSQGTHIALALGYKICSTRYSLAPHGEHGRWMIVVASTNFGQL
jgi:hypothetical protein